MNQYIAPTEEQGISFYKNEIGKGKGPLTMLNLLKFKKGMQIKFEQYFESVSNEITKMGAEIVLKSEFGSNLIGPYSKEWDMVIIVKYPSLEQFIDFSKSNAYLENLPLRNESLVDSRLIPISLN